MDFSKYEATANDFIMIDATTDNVVIDAALVRALCDRHTGIGADGVIIASPSQAADLRMTIINADGSVAEMCGNGARALFAFALRRGLVSGDSITVETLAGMKPVSRFSGPGGEKYSVEMGRPGLLRGEVPMCGPPDEVARDVEIPLEGVEPLSVTCLSMGNPHCVLFVDDVKSYPVERIGPLVENHPLFPERTNVEFVAVAPDGALDARVWERGVGETMACGTGACATVVAASLEGLSPGSGKVRLPGGELDVDWRDETVFLTGPARHVFDGKTVGA